MPEGTAVGNVYLDLVVRDTLTKQLQEISERASNAAQKQFSDIGKSLSDTMGKAMTHGMENTSRNLSKTVNGSFSKSVAIMQAKLNSMAKTMEDNEVRLGQIAIDTARSFAGSPWADDATESALKADKAYQALQRQQEKLETQMAYLREKLAIEVQAQAQKQAAAEQAAYAKAALAAERAAKRQQEAARQAHTTTAPPAATENANQSVDTEQIATDSEQSAEQTKSIWQKALDAISAKTKSVLGGALSSLWRSIKNGVAKAGSSLVGLAKKMLPFQVGIKKAGTGVQSFAVRLRSIVSGALVFNVISAGITKMVSAMGTALTSSSQMKTALANLKGAAATAAAPIIQILTPALAGLANAAATVFSYLSQLISFFTGKSVSAMASAAKGMSGVGSAAGGAAKEVKKANGELAAFDELNILNKKQEEDTEASGGGSGEIVPNYDFKGKSPFLDSIMASIKEGQWEQVGNLLAEKLNDTMAKIPMDKIDKTVSGWVANLARSLNGFVADLDWPLVGKTLADGLNVGLHAVDAFMTTFKFTALGDSLAKGLNSAIATLDWASLGRFITAKFRGVFETLHGFVQSFDFIALGESLATATMAAINNVDWVQAFGDGSTFIAGALQTMATWVHGIDWGSLGTMIADCLLAIDWSGIILSVVLLLGEALSALHELVASFWSELAKNCGDGLLSGLMEWISSINDWLRTKFIDPMVNSVKELLGIHSPSTVFAEIGKYIVQGLLNGISQTWKAISNFFSTSLTAVQKVFSDAWNGILTTTGDIWNSISTTIKDAINGIIGFVNGMIQRVVDGINSVADAIGSISFDLPGFLGGGHVGISIPKITAPQIPMLASGGVIDQPTLAMMGEYQGAGHDPEIAAPESKLKAVFSEQLNPLVDALYDLIAYLREVGDREVTIRFAGSIAELIRMLKPYIDKENNRVGAKLISGGVY